ncbi:FH1/FH2 domain-containing protein 3, partial [Austrofundulus limnaeus]|uniref:FH1/FH2 domain-containing protein 3 n=1 Tax=Austrofundulus limnaeus TaxID=52670 RepID=A0A2I4CM04_AUSLI
MASITCRVQYLEDSDPFICTNFPEPRRPPTVNVEENLPLCEQISGIHKLLEAPLKLEDCTLQVTPSGNYLDLDSSLFEQREELEGFYEDVAKGRKPILILRTQLSVRVHFILERLYNSKGPELRRCLFSLKQLFQDDKDLVPEFVASDGLTCFIKVGAEADHNYQNYILRALSQIMLFVDGMNGVINHNETVQWLYTLTGSPSRLLVKTALKLLIVFVEYAESNSPLLISAVNTVDGKRGAKPWTNVTEVLMEKNGCDTELLIFAMTLINKSLVALPDQDSFYDVADCLEQLGMETIIHKHMMDKGTEPDLRAQFSIYETSLRNEDNDLDDSSHHLRKDRRKLAVGEQEGRRGRRSSSQDLPNLLPPSPTPFTVPSPSSSSPVVSPAISSPSLTPVLGGRPLSPLSSDSSSSASSPSGSRRGSPLPPHMAPNGSVTTEQETKTPPSPGRSFLSHHMSALGLSRKSRLFSKASSICEEPPTSCSSPSDVSLQDKLQSQQTSEQPGGRTESKPGLNSVEDEELFCSDTCNVNQDKPVLRKLQGAFLSRLSATQWEKKRRSKLLSQSSVLTPFDDVINLSPQLPAELGDTVSSECTASTPSSSDPNQQSDSQNEPAALPTQRPCSTLSDDKKFVLDMIYSNTSAAEPNTTEEEKKNFKAGEDLSGCVSKRVSNFSSVESTTPSESSASRRAELESLEGSTQAARARLTEERQKLVLRQQSSIDVELHTRQLEAPTLGPGGSGDAWSQLQLSATSLRIKDLDFSDLIDEEDIDVLDMESSVSGSSFSGIPPPPPLPGIPPPPPPPTGIPPPPP